MRQVNLLTVNSYTPLIEVHRQWASRKAPLLRSWSHTMSVVQLHFDAGQDFLHIEGLDDVVIRTRVQCLHSHVYVFFYR